VTNGTPSKANNRQLRTRIIALAVIACVFLFYYGAHLFTLQIVNGLEYKRRAREVARKIIPIPAQRGEIYDRQLMPLALNINSFAVDVVPAEVASREWQTLFRRLAPVLNSTPSALAGRVPPGQRNVYQPMELKAGVGLDTIAYIAERIDDFPGITWRSKPIRSYVETGSVSHVLGYVGDITREELQVLYNRGYSYGTVLGKSGIEKQYDMLLRGRDGHRFRTVDVRGRRIREDSLEEVPPVLGKDLVLTIDMRIQRIAEMALGERIGSVVVLRPHNGEVLALVSYPWFDANMFYTDESARVFGELTEDSTYPFFNRAVQSAYPPASTFKTVMTTAVLEEDAFPLDRTIECKGSITVGDRVFKCHKETGHGPVALYEGLAESCDVYYYTVGKDYLGIETIAQYAREYGFGRVTGIDLPSEVPGLVPTPQWKERRYDEPWVGGDTVNTSIGQGYLSVTPIQLANMMAMVVNGGTVYKPHLLAEIRDPVSGQLIERREPEILHTVQFSDETFAQLQEAHRGVVTDGTAQVVITTDAVEVAGKTGTGEVGLEDRWHSWFAAYGPYRPENPEDQIVVVVMVEAANDWEWWAPHASNIIFQAIFADQSYEDAVTELNLWWYVAPEGRVE
jgi:penicillin-binding protein 2